MLKRWLRRWLEVDAIESRLVAEVMRLDRVRNELEDRHRELSRGVVRLEQRLDEATYIPAVNEDGDPSDGLPVGDALVMLLNASGQELVRPNPPKRQPTRGPFIRTRT